MRASRWNAMVLGGTLGILAIVAAVTIVVDPFLHYHEPLSGFSYPLQDERYQNDGMLRHFSYDVVITGTSMTQNFKPSEFDALWGTKALKIAFSGAGYKEVDETVRRALERNDSIRYVLRSLDGTVLNQPADYEAYEGYPEYLFDDNPFNDVQYLLNKEVVPKTLAVLNYTRAGNTTPTRDEYGNWSRYKVFGREEVMKSFVRQEAFEEEFFLSDEDCRNIEENVRKNVLQTALDNPQVEFYLFFPPYSICYWDACVRTKQLNAQLEAEEMAVRILLEAENIHVFAFGDNVELAADLNNYTDTLHYGEWVNSDILRWMREGEGELTDENYEEYYERVRALYLEYDFSWLYE